MPPEYARFLSHQIHLKIIDVSGYFPSGSVSLIADDFDVSTDVKDEFRRWSLLERNFDTSITVPFRMVMPLPYEESLTDTQLVAKERRETIVARHQAGKSLTDIARSLDITPQRVFQIVYGKGQRKS